MTAHLVDASGSTVATSQPLNITIVDAASPTGTPRNHAVARQVRPQAQRPVPAVRLRQRPVPAAPQERPQAQHRVPAARLRQHPVRRRNARNDARLRGRPRGNTRHNVNAGGYAERRPRQNTGFDQSPGLAAAHQPATFRGYGGTRRQGAPL